MVELHAPSHRLLVKADFTVQWRIQDFLRMGCTSKKRPQSNLMFFFACLFCFFVFSIILFISKSRRSFQSGRVRTPAPLLYIRPCGCFGFHCHTLGIVIKKSQGSIHIQSEAEANWL